MTETRQTDARAEIERIVLSYSHIVDARQWDRLGEVFAEDGSFVVEGTPIAAHGLATVRAFMESFGGHPLAHFTTNVVVDVAENGTRATAQSLVFGPGSGGVASVGRYYDDLIRTDAGWRFERRRVVVVERTWPRRD